jgi:hypothetical protein
MSFKIDFLGLIYFYRKGNGRLLLLPDGTAGGDGIPPHYASFFLETRKIIGTTNWEPLQNADLDEYCVCEYPIRYPSSVTISGVDTAARGGCLSLGSRGGIQGSHDSKVPHLKDCAPEMHIKPKKAKTIAQMPIQQGMLEAFLFEDAIVSRLTVTNHTGPITISATDVNGTKSTIVVRDETEIVLSNTSDLAGSHGQPEKTPKRGRQPSHFQLYSQLADDGKPHYLKDPTNLPDLPEFPSSQSYIVFLIDEEQVPGADCSNTCCSA